jgi:hypothetical protein
MVDHPMTVIEGDLNKQHQDTYNSFLQSSFNNSNSLLDLAEYNMYYNNEGSGGVMDEKVDTVQFNQTSTEAIFPESRTIAYTAKKSAMQP